MKLGRAEPSNICTGTSLNYKILLTNDTYAEKKLTLKDMVPLSSIVISHKKKKGECMQPGQKGRYEKLTLIILNNNANHALKLLFITTLFILI